jgi:hypothetical protein
MATRLTDIDDAESFFQEGRYQGCCAACGSTRSWEAHHVIQKQRCRREGAPLYSPDNALRVCAKSPDTCHERHTTHAELLPLLCLRDENIAFAERWLGAGPAYEYLTRYYAGSDPRVDALLEVIDGD